MRFNEKSTNLQNLLTKTVLSNEKISDKNTTLQLSLKVVKKSFTTMCKAGFFEAAHYRTHRHQNRDSKRLI